MGDNHAFAIETERKEKDHWFREAHQSPIPHAERHHFRGLRYYPVNPALRFRATLFPYAKQDPLRFPTSKGGEQTYLRVGYFEVSIEGKTVRIQAYGQAHEHGGHESLFVPFRDATSAKETYGAGRYLDLDKTKTGVYDLDFNRAYNPYCAYSDDYVCPFPPPENWLDVPVRAGEKAYERPPPNP